MNKIHKDHFVNYEAFDIHDVPRIVQREFDMGAYFNFMFKNFLHVGLKTEL